MFGPSHKQLIEFCHSFATMLDAGLPVVRTLDVLAGQARGGFARAIGRVRDGIEAGEGLAEAFARTGKFPSLFVELVSVGEESGALEATMARLTRHYELQQRLRRDLLRRMVVPVIYYVIAVAVVSVAAWIIATIRDEPTQLARHLLIGYGAPLALVAAYVFVVRPLGATRAVHEVLLRVPLLNTAARSLALARFSMVMELMLQSAVPVHVAVERACNATGNAAFAARGARAGEMIQQGSTLTEALAATGLFPPTDLNIIDVAEQSGTLTERFAWLSEHHADRAERAMAALVAGLGWLIYATVALIIIYFIFRIFTGYAGQLQRLAPRGR